MTATRASVTTAHVGASGFSYASWRPGFYPAYARPEDFLRLYADQLPSVELNVTGYRLPSEEQFARWGEQVSDGFTFAVKMPARAVRSVATFEERARRLGDKLGPIRVVVEQPRDEGFLALLLGSIDPELRYALDLRDPSWEGVDVNPAVRIGELDAEAPFRYLRFREPPYDEEALRELAAQISPLLHGGVEVFAYFRHEDEPTAPRYASRLLELLAPSSSGRTQDRAQG